MKFFCVAIMFSILLLACADMPASKSFSSKPSETNTMHITLVNDDKNEPDIESEPSVSVMNNQRLDQLIKQIDENAKGNLGFWQLQVKDISAKVITDERADRMRIIVAVTSKESLNAELLYRLLQANFDTALDARYAIAKDTLWSTFIHPLSTLDDREFMSGLAQTITLANTFGDTYSSGAIHFRGGDRQAAEQEFFQSLIESFGANKEAI